MLNEDNNIFSEEYAPVMKRLLGGNCTSKDVDYLNTRVLDGKWLGVHHWRDAKFISFRNKVSLNRIVCGTKRLMLSVHLPL